MLSRPGIHALRFCGPQTTSLSKLITESRISWTGKYKTGWSLYPWYRLLKDLKILAMTILKSKDIAEMQKTPRILLTKKIMSSKKIKSTLCQTKIISLNLTQVRWPFLTSNDVGDNKIHSDLHYKKKGEKDRVSNNFNACDTAQYKEQKQKKKSDLEYTKASLAKIFSVSESMIHSSILQHSDPFTTSIKWSLMH